MKHRSRQLLSTHKSACSPQKRRGGFTLIEVVIVLAIAALVTSITLGGFSSLTEGNRRTTCQTNMSQIYASLRLYAADEGGVFPFYNGDKTITTEQKNIGLWSLYTFHMDVTTPSDVDNIAEVGTKPVERYLRNAKVLHCPADLDTRTPLRNSNNLFNTTTTPTRYNADYLSYQVKDADGSTVETYDPARTLTRASSSTATATLEWKRQLIHYVPDGSDPGPDPDRVMRAPTQDTIVTWCRWHRGKRNKDNVLFYDGSVQVIDQKDPADQWLRTPKDPE